MENETNSNSINFDNIEFLRYVKIKDSIEALMKVIDKEKVEQHGKNKVLIALLQLINDNHGKLVDEKKEAIRGTLYDGNVLSHYFSDENKDKAIEILSHIDFIGKEENEAINEVEQYIFSINFYMPDDEAFSEVYKKCKKNPTEIAKYYGLSNYEDAENLVYGRIMEIARFYKDLENARGRQRLYAATEILAAMQSAKDDPSVENIAKVKDMLKDLDLENESLRETIETELRELEELAELSTTPEESEGLEAASIAEQDEDFDFAEETEVPEEDVLEAEEPTELMGEEIHQTVPANERDYSPEGQDVMAALQKIVSEAKHNLGRIATLEEDVKSRDSRISDLEGSLAAANEESSKKDEIIEMQRTEIGVKDSDLVRLHADLIAKDENIADMRQLIALRDRTINEKETQMADLERTKDEEIERITTTKDEEIARLRAELEASNANVRFLNNKVESHQALLSEMKQFLTASQPEVTLDEARKR